MAFSKSRQKKAQRDFKHICDFRRPRLPVRGVSGNWGRKRTRAMSVYSSASAASGSAPCFARQSATTSATVASAGISAPNNASKWSSSSCSIVGDGARAEGVFFRMLLCSEGMDGSASSAAVGSAAGISTSAGPRARALRRVAISRISRALQDQRLVQTKRKRPRQPGETRANANAKRGGRHTRTIRRDRDHRDGRCEVCQAREADI